MSTQKNAKIEAVSQTEAPLEEPGSIHQPQSEAPNPFDDMDSLRINQDFVARAGVKKLLTTVPVKRPNKQTFVRVRSEPEYHRDFACIELRDEGEFYIVAPNIASALPDEVTYRTFYTSITRQGVLFLWPVNLPSPDGRRCDWHISARVAAETAMTKWIRVVSKRELGAYEIWKAEGDFPEPEWPDVSFSEICKVAFRDNPTVQSFDHPVIKRLRGLA
jgi:hypothetical protein